MLTDKIILITGGTGTLGAAFVRHALAEHARVFFTYCRNRALAKELENKGARGICCDFLEKHALPNLSAVLFSEITHLDILINNAAIVRDHIIPHISEADWDAVLTVNYQTPVHLTHTFLPLLNKNMHGKIINIISRVGAHGGFGQANYAAAKDALIEFTKIAAIEYGGKGICVCGVNPGFMESELTATVPTDMKELNRAKSVQHTFSDPHEVAAFLVYLCSDSCTRISGQIFHYDSRLTPE